jgi:hypothetical protein
VKKFNYAVLYGCTKLACTQLDVLKHYYPEYTVLDFEPDFHDEFETEISKAKYGSNYEVLQQENVMLTPRKQCMDHQAPYQHKGLSGTQDNIKYIES